MTDLSGHTKRWAIAAGSIGLVSGIGLGVTGLASATSPAPSNAITASADGDERNRRHPRLDKRMGHGPGGLVTKVNATSLTVSTVRGSKTVQLNGSTTFYEGKQQVSASAIDVGEVVHIRLTDPQASSPVAAVVRVVPAHVGGWVTAIEGSTITLVDRAGFTRIVSTGSTTAFTKDGASSSLAALTVGDFVHAAGSVDGDGTTLTATQVLSGKWMREKESGSEPDL